MNRMNRTAFVGAPLPSARRALVASASQSSGFLAGRSAAVRPVAASTASRRVLGVRMTAAEAASETESAGEKFEFQAEVSRVMDLIINSLYSNKEIFLRELVSNASDACDKKRFLSITDASAAEEELSIRVKADEKAGVVVIEDSGIGLSRQEMIDNLGSIATSGTKKFMEALGDGKGDVSQIGQFGVGFYSSFLVADRVKVQSKSMATGDGKQYSWESDSKSGYTIKEDVDEAEMLPGKSGTRMTLYIKDGSKEFLENSRLATLMRKYSEFVTFPIYSWEQKTDYDEVPDGEEKDDAGNQKMKRVPRTVEDWAQVNVQKPIWMRRPKEVEDSEYEEFYKTISKDFAPPVARSHFAVEGEIEFRSVIFTPKMLPFELRENMFDENGKSLRLYVKRVFISDKFDGFVPRWLTFVRGVIDSEDLPLNVSREILQQSRVLRVISKRLIRKSLDMFREIAEREDRSEYDNFWGQFGRYLKAGVIDDKDYQDELARLLRFNSANSPDELISFEEYVAKMKEGQNDIYYMSADNKIAAQNSAMLESLKKKGYDALFLLEPIDEISFQNLSTFKCRRNEDDAEETEFKLVDIGKEDFKMDKTEDEEKAGKEREEEFKLVTEYMQKQLSESVAKVQISDRLTDSASTIVQGQYGMSATMERYMRMNKTSEDAGFETFMSGARILEINPEDGVVKDLKARLEANADGDTTTEDSSRLLFELAMLGGGYPVDDTPGFAKRVSRLISDAVISKPKTEKAPPKVDDDKVETVESEVV